MSNENNRENMDITQPEKASTLCTNTEKSPEPCKPAAPIQGVAIKTTESQSLNSLLAYDSDSSSSSSEMMKLNLNWQARNESEDSSSSSSSSSSSDEDSDSSSDDDEEPPAPANKGAIRKSAPLKPDEPLEQLPPVPDLSKLNISVDDETFVHMGNVLGIVDKLVTIAAIPNTPAYDLDTLLFLDNGKRPLGFVFDVLGQVTSPIYAVRFNSIDDIKNLEIEIGSKVYSAPTSKHTQYIFLQQLLKMKGSDASWLEDAEVPDEFADFSDDENECFQRFGNKKVVPHLKRTHSGENYKKFESSMNRRNLLNTKLNKYMDSYKQARANKVKAKRSQAPIVVPPFDPSVPPPNLAHYMALCHQEYVYDPGNNNPPHFLRENFSNFYSHPGPSHQ